MNEDNKIPLTTICARLERAIHCDVGMKGLKTLLFGFNKKTGLCPANNLRVRFKRDGFEFMNERELRFFSIYAGYDLSKD